MSLTAPGTNPHTGCDVIMTIEKSKGISKKLKTLIKAIKILSSNIIKGEGADFSFSVCPSLSQSSTKMYQRTSAPITWVRQVCVGVPLKAYAWKEM